MKNGLDGFSGEKIQNPVKAIRSYCLECVGSSPEVEKCPLSSCELYPFRFGSNPYRTRRELTEEEKETLRKKLEFARSQR